MQGKYHFFEPAKPAVDIIHQYNPCINQPDSDGRQPDTKHQMSGYGESHLQGRRKSQEDGSFFVQSTTSCVLTPQQVAQRLWSTIKIADALVKNEGAGQDEGTTACVACVHQEHLILQLIRRCLSSVDAVPSHTYISSSILVKRNLHLYCLYQLIEPEPISYRSF